ncbi:hypothetical protein AB3S75_013475 [Citrus x aurantiifolia]
MKTATLPFGGFGHSYLPSSSFKIVIVMAKSNKKSRSSSSSSKVVYNCKQIYRS